MFSSSMFLTGEKVYVTEVYRPFCVSCMYKQIIYLFD